MTARPRDPAIQSFVDKLLGVVTPKRWQGFYSPFGHLAATVGISGSAAAYALWHVGAWRWAPDLGFVLAMYGTANLFEWFAHKYALHARLPGFVVLYDEHTRKHHRIYRTDDMTVRPPTPALHLHRFAEWQFVLIPARGIFGAMVAGAGMSTLLGLALGPHFGWLALTTFALYVLSYELLHLAYHSAWLEEPRTKASWRTRPVERLLYNLSWTLRKLRAHHAWHHHPALMRRWNMNVTVPLADLLLGTIAPRVMRAKIAAADRVQKDAEPDWD